MKNVFKMFLGLAILMPVSAMAERQFCCLASFGSSNVSSFWCITNQAGANYMNNYYQTDYYKPGTIQGGGLNQDPANNCTAAEEAICDAAVETPEPSPIDCEDIPVGSPVPSECSEVPSEPTPTPTPPAPPVPTPVPFPIPTGVDCSTIPTNFPFPNECEPVPVPGNGPGEDTP